MKKLDQFKVALDRRRGDTKKRPPVDAKALRKVLGVLFPKGARA